IYAHVRRELEGAGVKVAQTGISSRTTFAIAATNGTAPAWMFSQGKAAALEVAMLADEIDLVLRRAKK
ncbi:MAG: hypothetical protein RL434_1038, partial [Pseudomonadota bacterium]